MYQAFFGFQRAPFELVPDPDFLFLGESHDSALANLVIGIESGKGFVAISGPIGAGKTTVLRALLRRIHHDQPVCFLSQPEIEINDLLRSIAHGFGIAEKSLDRVELRQAIRDLLQNQERPGILIVDEAHLLTEETLEQIRLLSNLEEDHRKLLQIVLAGQPELKELLSRPRLRPLTQRIEMFYDIRPLNFQETCAYIDRRIRIAGNPEGLHFEAKALDRIFLHSGGIPRLINVLADRCLITAYVGETKTISDKVVREAYDDLGEVTQSVMAGGWCGPEAAPALAPAPPPVVSVAAPPVEPHRPPWSPRSTPGAAHGMDRERADRWFAAGGVVAIALLALLSLGNHELAARSVAAGTAPLRLDGEAVDPSAGPFAVHVATVHKLGDARELARELREETGEKVRISAHEDLGGPRYRVLFGEYESLALADETKTRLENTREFDFMRTLPVPPTSPPATGESSDE